MNTVVKLFSLNKITNINYNVFGKMMHLKKRTKKLISMKIKIQIVQLKKRFKLNEKPIKMFKKLFKKRNLKVIRKNLVLIE